MNSMLCQHFPGRLFRREAPGHGRAAYTARPIQLGRYGARVAPAFISSRLHPPDYPTVLARDASVSCVQPVFQLYSTAARDSVARPSAGRPSAAALGSARYLGAGL